MCHLGMDVSPGLGCVTWACMCHLGLNVSPRPGCVTWAWMCDHLGLDVSARPMHSDTRSSFTQDNLCKLHGFNTLSSSHSKNNKMNLFGAHVKSCIRYGEKSNLFKLIDQLLFSSIIFHIVANNCVVWYGNFLFDIMK